MDDETLIEGADKQTQPEGSEIDNNNLDTDLTIPTTAEELRALLQKEGDKRVSSAQKKWQDKQKEVIEKEKLEATKLAKMSAAEREKATYLKERAEFEAEKASMAKERLKMQTTTELANEGLPVDFVNYVLAETAEDINSNIKAFKTLWTSSLEKAVADRIATPTPKKGTSNLNKASSSKNSMIDAINSKRIRK